MACSDSAFSTFHTAVEGIWLKCADCLAFLPVATASCSGVLDFATFSTNFLSRQDLHVAVGMCGKILSWFSWATSSFCGMCYNASSYKVNSGRAII